jgi:hypothetical protein
VDQLTPRGQRYRNARRQIDLLNELGPVIIGQARAEQGDTLEEMLNFGDDDDSATTTTATTTTTEQHVRGRGTSGGQPTSPLILSSPSSISSTPTNSPQTLSPGRASPGLVRKRPKMDLRSAVNGQPPLESKDMRDGALHSAKAAPMPV